MIIALCGPSGVGKTTVARALGEALGRPIRCCGHEIGLRLETVGRETLPDRDHREIDRATRQYALTTPQGIVEGRFLAYVLEGLPEVFLVELRCALQERIARARAGRDPRREDQQDALFTQRLYARAREPNLVLDSTSDNVATIVERVLEATTKP